MSISKRKTDVSDDRLRAAIALGFGSTGEEAAEFSGKSLASINRWKQEPEIARICEAVAAYKSIDASKQISSAVSEVVESAEDRIRRLFDRSLRLSERALERAEAEGDGITYEQLVAIHESFTKWASKYVVSEAPKRISMEGNIEHTYKAVISLAEADNFISARKQLQSIGPKLIAGDSNVIDIPADA